VESLQSRGPYRSSTFTAGQADYPETLLAYGIDGEPLHIDHGFPVRLIAPNRPGVLQTKWVARVVVL
jgi:DMSO/TMAO reductase YedYZ molybdopterin-dependent catalytic subunit